MRCELHIFHNLQDSQTQVSILYCQGSAGYKMKRTKNRTVAPVQPEARVYLSYSLFFQIISVKRILYTIL